MSVEYKMLLMSMEMTICIDVCGAENVIGVYGDENMH